VRGASNEAESPPTCNNFSLFTPPAPLNAHSNSSFTIITRHSKPDIRAKARDSSDADPQQTTPQPSEGSVGAFSCVYHTTRPLSNPPQGTLGRLLLAGTTRCGYHRAMCRNARSWRMYFRFYSSLSLSAWLSPPWSRTVRRAAPSITCLPWYVSQSCDTWVEEG
jgi:hypothetical protein